MLTRDQKKEIIKDAEENLKEAKITILANYQGLKVAEISNLRNQFRQESISFHVIKNTLLKIAAKHSKIDIAEELFQNQPVAIIFSQTDEILPTKIIKDFAKTNENLKVIGGIYNQSFVDHEYINKLASIPSREELYAKAVGSIAAPISGMVNVLAGNLRGLVSVLKQYQATK